MFDQISEEMKSAVLYRLAQNDVSLKELSLHGNCMGPKGAAQLASALRYFVIAESIIVEHVEANLFFSEITPT